jgi:hypothetical protein
MLPLYRLRDHPYPKKIEESSSFAAAYGTGPALLFLMHLDDALYFLPVLV